MDNSEILLLGMFRPLSIPNKDKTEWKFEENMVNERKRLAKALEKNTINYKIVNSKWPRDDFVNHNGKIFSRDKYGFYADGGYILNNSEFTLACSEVSSEVPSIPNSFKDNSEKRYSKLQDLYGKDIFILPAPDLSWNQDMSPHIDLVVLPIPEIGTVFTDSRYYEEIAKDEIDNLSEKYQLKVSKVDNDYENPSYPCNSLILRQSKNPKVIVNSKGNKRFIDNLEKRGLETIAVPFSNNCFKGGGIRCATNTIPSEQQKFFSELYS